MVEKKEIEIQTNIDIIGLNKIIKNNDLVEKKKRVVKD
jgi:hypothetical protein